MVRSYNKGWRGEKIVRDMFKEAGLEVKWHNNDSYLPDLSVEGLLCEVKFGLKVPKTIYKWLDKNGSHICMMKRVSKKERGDKWLMVIPADIGIEFLKDFFRK